MSTQRILVTGGAGFIGSHVVDAFCSMGHDVVVLDDLSSGRRENVPAAATLLVADIRSPDAAAAMADVDVLCHHAAQIDVRRSTDDPRYDADVNLGGLLNLVEAGRRSRLRQVIFASTGGAIYGEQDAFPATEAHREWPVSPYGVAKLAGERYLHYYHHQYDLDVACLRYANVYGPRQNPHGEAGVVAIFCRRLLAGEAPVIYGDGEQTRDYVFVGDVVRANVAALGREGFGTWNVGTGTETTVRALFDHIAAAAAADCAPRFAAARPGEQLRSCISSAKLWRDLGVRPETALADGVAATVDWFREA